MSQDIEREKEIAAGARRATSYPVPPVELVNALRGEHEGWVSEVVEAFGELTLVVPRSSIVAVCAHRGTLLCEGESGQLVRLEIRCPYHGWTYATDGTPLDGCNIQVLVVGVGAAPLGTKTVDANGVRRHELHVARTAH